MYCTESKNFINLGISCPVNLNMRVPAALRLNDPRGRILTGRNIYRRVLCEEVRWADHELEDLDWPVYLLV